MPIFLLFVDDFIVENTPQHITKVVPSAPKHKEAGTCLPEKLGVLRELCSGMGYSTLAVSSVLMNHQYIYEIDYLLAETCGKQSYILIMNENVARGSQEPNPIFPLGAIIIQYR